MLLDRLRLRLARAEALTQLTALGALTGVLAGGIILAFRWGIEAAQGLFLPPGTAENYEALPTWARLTLPIGGALVIGIALQAASPVRRQVGVVHVMERLDYHQAHLPVGNAVMQFFGALVSIVSGHSVGREGPGVHLGAVNGSILGEWLQLPNNSVRTLVACGVAAAIAASFNTPLAGVVFAMEVVMFEYSAAGFAPVILAAVSATALTHLAYGPAPAFAVPPLEMGSLWELPYVLLAGVVIGGLSAAFTRLLQFFSRLGHTRPIWLRCLGGGILVGLCAVVVPEIMGIGYDTVEAALLGELGLTTMVVIVAIKLLATTAGLGLGLPGGLIGPTLVIGAAAGGAFGLIAKVYFPEVFASYAFYAMIGMGAMMGGTLQAPLAALTALLELTANPNILLPGMLAILAAHLTNSELFHKGPVFVELMRARGLDYRSDPVAQVLRRLGVMAVIDRSFEICSPQLARTDAEALLRRGPHWLLVRDRSTPTMLLEATDLALHLETRPDAERVDLLEFPSSSRIEPPGITPQATLQEALDALQRSDAYGAYVVDRTHAGSTRLFGVVTQREIESNYRYNGRPAMRQEPS